MEFLEDSSIDRLIQKGIKEFESVDLDEEWEKRTLELLSINKEWVRSFSTDG